MFVPIVPFVPHTTVVNKTIVYSDTVLPLKDTGSNLKVTSIKNVSEHSLESCLKTIFESNPNVVFNTIQYSKNDETVYFYTNKQINIREFEESKFIKYKPINSRSAILEEVKRLLTSDKITNNDCISLYDVAVLISQKNYRYETLKDSYQKYFNRIIKSAFGSSSNLAIYNFEYDKNELGIGFNYIGNNYDKITFIKKESDLCISKSESFWAKKILTIIGVELSELYDKFTEFSSYKKESKYRINPVNSSFLVYIGPYGVSIFVESPTNTFMKDFKLTFPSYSNQYNYDCNSTTVTSAFRGKENEIFKRRTC